MDDTTHLMALQTFFRGEGWSKTGHTRARYQRVHANLLRFLDHADMAPWTGTHPAALLDAERQFGGGAFFRVLDFDDLICCLPGFVALEWLLSAPADRRAQISLTARLVVFLDRNRLIDRRRVGCAYWDVEGAVRRARRRSRLSLLPNESLGS